MVEVDERRRDNVALLEEVVGAVDSEEKGCVTPQVFNYLA
jgi:hypothetical protein